MRGIIGALPLAVVLLAPPLVAAQPLDPFRDLALRVNLGDRVRIEDHGGARTTGRLTGLSPDAITLQTEAGETLVPGSAVREVAVRRTWRRRYVLAGAGAGAVIGALAACAGSDREACPEGALLAGGVGAGVGLALSGLVSRTTILYPSPAGPAPGRGQAGPPGPFDELALRVDLGDRLQVEDRSGVKTTGRLTRLTGDELVIDTDDREAHFTSAGVRAVRVRGHRLGPIAALIGAGAYVAAVAAAPSCRSDPDCLPIAAAPFGAGLGLVVGALIPRMTTVFPWPATHLSWAPAISRAGLGVRAGLRW